MPGLKVAVASGNWSNPATWYAGTLPSVGDTVASNGFTVTIDQDVNVDSLVNSVATPISIIPIMTSYTAPSGTVTFSTEYDANTYAAWKAFDGSIASNTNHWLSANGTFVPPQWIAYEFPSPVLVNGYSLASSYTMPRDFQIQGWNGTTWDTLTSVTANVATSINGTFTNSTSYAKYRLYITANNNTQYTSAGEFKLFSPNYSPTPSVAGGSFVINSSVTVVTNSVYYTTTPVLTISNPLGTTVNLTTNPSNLSVSNVSVIVFSGSGVLNFNGTITAGDTGKNILLVNGSGTLNYVGDIYHGGNNSGGTGIQILSSTAVVNYTGTIFSANGSSATAGIQTAAACTMNATGTFYGNSNGSANATSAAIRNSGGASITITGNLIGSYTAAVYSNSVSYIKIIGSITSVFSACFNSANYSAINLLTGPFISGNYGAVPYICQRVHLIPTSNSYFEFRDETTNGALSPGAIAPATRLYSPSTVVDAPATSNVRSGVVYALGTRTGTMVAPTANKVRGGVAVDNTVGTAVLTVADVVNAVWGAMSSGLTTSGSIGERTKNSITAAALGDQLAAFN